MCECVLCALHTFHMPTFLSTCSQYIVSLCTLFGCHALCIATKYNYSTTNKINNRVFKILQKIIVWLDSILIRLGKQN